MKFGRIEQPVNIEDISSDKTLDRQSATYQVLTPSASGLSVNMPDPSVGGLHVISNKGSDALEIQHQTVSTTQISVNDGGDAGAQQVYGYTSDVNGKPSYEGLTDTNYILQWDGVNWTIHVVGDDINLYYSDEDVDNPTLVTTWYADQGATPVPTEVEFASEVVSLLSLPAGESVTVVSDGQNWSTL